MRIVKRFRGGLVFEAHRLVYHSTLGVRVIKKIRRFNVRGLGRVEVAQVGHRHSDHLLDSVCIWGLGFEMLGF